MSRYSVVFLVFTLFFNVYADEHGTRAAVYSINGAYVGSMEVAKAPRTAQVSTITTPQTVFVNGIQRTLSRGVYFLAPEGYIPPGVTFSTHGSFGFSDATGEYLPQMMEEAGMIKIGDVNGDSLEDIVFSIYSFYCDSTIDQRPRLWLQGPDGIYYDATDSLIPDVNISSYSLQLFDADGDGDLDIFIPGGGCEGGLSYLLLINDGAGHFSDESSIRLPNLPGYHPSATIGDIDDNNFQDILLPRWAANSYNSSDTVFYTTEILLNRGDGTFFVDTTNRLVDSGKYTVYTILLEDINNDSYQDIIYANLGSMVITGDDPTPLETTEGGTAIFINDGNDRFRDETSSRYPGYDNDIIRKVVAGDIDSDGDVDLFELGMLFETFQYQNRFLRNDGTGHFTVWTEALPESLTGWFNDAQIAHFNNDGHPDLFLPKVIPGVKDYDVLLLNNGNGIFSDSSNYLPHVLDFTASSAVFDHKKDGDKDIVCANTGPSVADSGGQNSLYQNILYSIDGIKERREVTTFTLSQAYPNPFNPSTSIEYILPHTGYVSLRVYDLLGKNVATLVDGIETMGTKRIIFHADNLPTGVYYYRLQAGTFSDVKKMVLVR